MHNFLFKGWLSCVLILTLSFLFPLNASYILRHNSVAENGAIALVGSSYNENCLSLPSGSSIIYAELIWSGPSWIFDEDVTLISPDNVTHQIISDPETMQDDALGSYVRSANVTSIVEAGGVGVYTALGMPTQISWTLAVVYKNPTLHTSELSLFVGCEDDYAINALAIQTEVDAPIINAIKTINGFDAITSDVGQIVNTTITVQNTGTETAYNVLFKDVLPPGLALVNGSFKINGCPEAFPDISAGVPLGDFIPDGPFTTVEYQVKIVAPPSVGNVYSSTSNIAYTYVPNQANEPADLEAASDPVFILIPLAPNNFEGRITTSKFQNKSQYHLKAQWTPVTVPDLIGYRIYSNSDIVANISAEAPLIFKTSLETKQAAKNYEIAGVYSGDVESHHVKLRIVQE